MTFKKKRRKKGKVIVQTRTTMIFTRLLTLDNKKRRKKGQVTVKMRTATIFTR